LYLHRGQVTVTLGTRRVVAEAGTFVYIPAATWIGVENTGREPASVVGIFGEGRSNAASGDSFSGRARLTRCASSSTAR
jgi:mannose-6-phosphate isomerase-like protein (cupin superfamily)